MGLRVGWKNKLQIKGDRAVLIKLGSRSYTSSVMSCTKVELGQILEIFQYIMIHGQ